MKCLSSDISSIIDEYIKDRQYTFVFNSQVSSASWALRCVKKYQGALDLQRFIAWDEFTKLCIPATGKKEVDGTIRRMFSCALIEENAISPFLQTVIPPSFASDAQYLAPSIAKRLPALNMLNKLCCNTLLDTDEINDYKAIYARYKSFMENNNMIETSWQMPKDDIKTGAKYILFYPIILEDWVQYEEALSKMENITVVKLPPDVLNKGISSRLYPNARMELRKTALYIRKLLSSGEDASSIALTVPNLASIRPYVERELYLYDIPFVTHIALPLFSSGIGRMFNAIYECCNADFSLSAMRTLLQSCSVPWTPYDADGKCIDWPTELVRIGSEMRCLCHWGADKKNPWDEVLKDKKMERERVWYGALKNAVTSFVTQNSFSKMRQVWFNKWRRGGLLDEEAFMEGGPKYSKDADAVLSRCITALYKLERLEKELSSIKITNHYEFFLNELKETLYTPQQEDFGINVFDYKVASSAAYKHNIVINASQENVTVNYKTLDFLSEPCKKALLSNGIEGQDVSKECLSLYGMGRGLNGSIEVSASSEGFSGFSTPHSFLSIVRNGKKCGTREELDGDDFVTKEREYFAKGECAPVVSNRQTKEINEWSKRLAAKAEDKMPSPPVLQSAVHRALKAKSGEPFSPTNPMQISATSMNKFFPCARKWLFNNALKLSGEETFDTDLMSGYSSGNILHKILELFCTAYMEQKEVLPTVLLDGTFGEAEDTVKKQVMDAANEAVKSVSDNSHTLLSMPLVRRALEMQLNGYVKRVMNFLHYVCKEDERGKDGNVSKYFIGGKYVKGVEVEKELRSTLSSYKMIGRIDCLLQTESGGNIIIDYKSTKPPEVRASTVNDDGKIEDFQMPMYVALMGGDVEEASFLHIASGTYNMIVCPKCPASSYEATTARLEEYAEHFAKRVQSMDFLPSDLSQNFSPLNVWENCPPCPFNCICRKTYSRE